MIPFWVSRLTFERPRLRSSATPGEIPGRRRSYNPPVLFLTVNKGRYILWAQHPRWPVTVSGFLDEDVEFVGLVNGTNLLDFSRKRPRDALICV